MRALAILLSLACAAPLAARDNTAADAVFAAALANIREHLQAAPPADAAEFPANAVAVARRTTGGAPAGYRAFAEKFFGQTIAEELTEAYGDAGPAARKIERETAGGFPVLPLEQFEKGTRDYDWPRLNETYPDVQYVVRLSWPAVDRLDTVAVVRYEVIGRKGPQWAALVRYEKQNDGSWRPRLHQLGSIWE